jgi:hypothetical protein
MMNITAKQLETLEGEFVSLHASLQKILFPPNHSVQKPSKDRTKLLNLFGAWDGETDTFLQEFYARREKRGRLE